MSVFDLIVLVILIALTVRGVLKGMVSQIVAVGSLFVSWIVASRFAFVIAPSIPAEPPWDKIGAMVVLFVISMVAIRLCAQMFEKWLKKMKLESLNTWLGGVLGFVKGLLVCMVLTFFGVMLSEMSREIVFQSKSGKHLALLIERTGAFIPRESWQLLSDKIGEFNAKVRGDEATADVLAQTESDYAQNSQIGQLFSQGSTLLNEVQGLRDGIQKEKEKASSFLDAVARWWKGDAADTAATTDPPPQRDVPTTFTTDQPAMLRSASVAGLTSTPDNITPPSGMSSGPPPALSSPAIPPASPDSTAARQTPRAREDSPFMRRGSQAAPAPPPDDLTSLLPASSQPVLQDSFSAESQAMSIPQSRGTFRVRSRRPGTATPLDRMLKSDPTTGPRQSATLFRP